MGLVRSNRSHALRNGVFAFLSLVISFVLGAVVPLPREFQWIFPMVGILGYVYFSRRALLAWRPDLDRLWRAPERGRFPRAANLTANRSNLGSVEPAISIPKTGSMPIRGR
jgi:hypothetical protein